MHSTAEHGCTAAYIHLLPSKSLLQQLHLRLRTSCPLTAACITRTRAVVPTQQQAITASVPLPLTLDFIKLLKESAGGQN